MKQAKWKNEKWQNWNWAIAIETEAGVERGSGTLIQWPFSNFHFPFSASIRVDPCLSVVSFLYENWRKKRASLWKKS